MKPFPALSMLLLSTLILSAGACDDADHGAACEASAPVSVMAFADPDAVSLREQGPPQGIYITTRNGKPIHRGGFQKLIAACDAEVDPPLTCTLSWYQPDTSQPERVLGIGCSTMATWSLWACYLGVWQDNDGIAF